MTRALLAIPALALGLIGCSDDPSVTAARSPGAALYSPSTGVLPVPSDLLYLGSTDATLNIPAADPTNYSDPQVAISALDGWSTVSEFRLPFSRPLDFDTVTLGTTVRLFEVTTLVTATQPVGGPVTGVVGEVLELNLFSAEEDATGGTLVVQPTAPLKAATSYMLVVTDGVRDSEGFPMARAREFELAAAALPWTAGTSIAALQSLIGPMLDAAVAQGIARDEVILTNVFTTQGIADVSTLLLGISSGLEQNIINGLCAQLPGGCDSTVPDPRSTPVLGASFTAFGTTGTFGGAALADVYQGSVTLPYYLTAAANSSASGTSNDTAPIDEIWRARYPFVPGDTERNVTRFNPLPAITGQEMVPMLVSIPNMASGQTRPVTGWPVVLFQHGVTQNRGNLLGIADALAARGIAAVAIDLPLHGVTDTTNPLFTSHLDGTVRERSFGLDLIDGDGAPGPDGTIDGSGAHFINLANLLAIRDNVRQGHADLLNMVTLLPAINADGDADLDFDPLRVHFIGHSLGAIVGMGAFSLLPAEISKTFAMPSGSLPKMLVASPSFQDPILIGLEANGVLPGTSEFEAFLFAAQSVTDAIDPVNYAQAYSTAAQRVHVIEVVGDGGATNLPDQSIPPVVEGAPLAGTEALISLMNLPGVSATVIDAGGTRGAVRFLEGAHSSFVSPLASGAAFTEMQGEAAQFAASAGTEIRIDDPAIVQ